MKRKCVRGLSETCISASAPGALVRGSIVDRKEPWRNSNRNVLKGWRGISDAGREENISAAAPRRYLGRMICFPNVVLYIFQFVSDPNVGHDRLLLADLGDFFLA
jgi:hypothetical protein